VPAGHLHVVVELVVAVPADHHVAKAEAFIDRALEFVAADILAAEHPIDVEQADPDIEQVALAHVINRFLSGFNGRNVSHGAPRKSLKKDSKKGTFPTGKKKNIQ
jgi:hypothetical protein